MRICYAKKKKAICEFLVLSQVALCDGISSGRSAAKALGYCSEG